ncbi:hypothetical protein GCM10010174_24470 [Kutzneria viridogrisea]|uniref:Secreted protein n=1 Tax=Kutzneria albida DSM 43870 TaxID=1449976 RepID=W5W4Z0_9PSEU|nr:histidine phosphatase family protein [Kutzneria albida]AHH95835.1 hypothetical protein KALB_2467 [Kutzneria albida DSM 43870]
MRASRRTALKLFAATGAAAAVPIGTASAATSAADVVMLIRHGEKPADSGAPYGIDADGNTDDASLTTRGWSRAGALAALFAPAGTPIKSGLRTPTAIYATTSTSKKHHRMLETVTPLADKLGLTVNTSHAKGDTSEVAADVAKRTGTTLVCWEHTEIPEIAAALGKVSPTPPSTWPDERFDVVWVFTRNGSGWTFSQVPQQLLSGDSATGI